jgi:uncharacterized protein DUF4267
MSILSTISIAIGAIPIGFGINWFRDTSSGLSFFDLALPASGSAHRATVECLGAVIGVRNLFMGIGIITAGLFREKRTLGVLLLSVALVAVVDGVAMDAATGGGAVGHWSYAPVVATLGIANLWTA